MLPRLLHAAGLRSWLLHSASLTSVLISLSLWIRSKTIDQEARGNAERRAIFVGHWAPMFWLLGDAAEREEQTLRRRAGRGARRRRGALVP